MPDTPGPLAELPAGNLTAWDAFFEQEPVDADAYARKKAMLDRQIERNGMRYRIYGDPASRPATWSLGLLPLLLDPEEWRAIEAGVKQRTSLLNRIAADCYGEETLVKQGLLPSALTVGHPGYLRAMKGHQPPRDVYLHIAAFDLARDRHGNWCVISQRTQAPSGLGYLLENRFIVSQLFPEAFRELGVRQITFLYRRLLHTLETMTAEAGIAPDGPPQIALLTPGPFNETYFEQAYLARFLGIPLVEGDDLAVRGGRVYLKTVNGLTPVHGLIRRIDDDYSDPLEFRPDSTLGVAGLAEAVREGNLLVANALGTSFLESPALQGFMPGISHFLDDEKLSMPSLDSIWCGEAAAMPEAYRQLAKSVVKPTYPASRERPSFEPLIAPRATAKEIEAARKRIEHYPEAHTLQTYMQLAATPYWQEDSVRKRPFMLRVFTLYRGQDSWDVLPGGLARLAGADPYLVSMQYGGGSADCWVLSGGTPNAAPPAPPPVPPADVRRRPRIVTSRAAENLFWMGRYAERLINDLRFLRTVGNLIAMPSDPDRKLFAALSRIASTRGLVAGLPLGEPEVLEQALLAGLSTDGESILARNLAALKRAAEDVTYRLPLDLVRILDQLTPIASAEVASGLLELDGEFNRLIIDLQALGGVLQDGMQRDEGWRYLSVGRMLERLGTMATSVHSVFEEPGEPGEAAYDFLLEIFECAGTYRGRYQQLLDIPPLLDLIVLDDGAPRSLGASLHFLVGELELLSQAHDMPPLERRPHFESGSLPDLEELSVRGRDGHYEKLLELCEALATESWEMATEITRRRFVHIAERQRSFPGPYHL